MIGLRGTCRQRETLAIAGFALEGKKQKQATFLKPNLMGSAASKLHGERATMRHFSPYLKLRPLLTPELGPFLRARDARRDAGKQ
jgi:hypothetical protein